MMRFQKVTRVEVVDDLGRSYTTGTGGASNVAIDLQDDGRTLKVFLTGRDVDETADT